MLRKEYVYDFITQQTNFIYVQLRHSEFSLSDRDLIGLQEVILCAANEASDILGTVFIAASFPNNAVANISFTPPP